VAEGLIGHGGMREKELMRMLMSHGVEIKTRCDTKLNRTEEQHDFNKISDSFLPFVDYLWATYLSW